jgi:hypothetical protein
MRVPPAGTIVAQGMRAAIAGANRSKCTSPIPPPRLCSESPEKPAASYQDPDFLDEYRIE